MTSFRFFLKFFKSSLFALLALLSSTLLLYLSTSLPTKEKYLSSREKIKKIQIKYLYSGFGLDSLPDLAVRRFLMNPKNSDQILNGTGREWSLMNIIQISVLWKIEKIFSLFKPGHSEGTCKT